MERTGNSKLLQMKARYQQKQLEEREMKIASLYEAQQARALDRVRHSPSNGVVNGVRASPDEPKVPIHPGKLEASEYKIALLYEAQQARALERVRQSPSNGFVRVKKSKPLENLKDSVQPGKVRQMFEERRTKAGIDKSYPLQPIHNTDRPVQKKSLPNGFSKVTAKSNVLNHQSKTSTTAVKAEKKVSSRTTVKKSYHHVAKTTSNNMVNGSGDLNHNHEQDLNQLKHTHSQRNGEPMKEIDESDRVDNNYLLENETFPDALAPEPTPRSPEPKDRPQRTPEPKEPKRPPRRSPPNKNSQSKPQTHPVVPPRRTASNNNATHRKSPVVSSTHSTGSGRVSRTEPVKAAGPSSAGGAGGGAGGGAVGGGAGAAGAPCAVCGRRFAPDRLEVHQQICRKAAGKKRKPFDALKHRLAGTEAETLIPKLRKQQVAGGANSSSKVNKPINSNWRKQHEEFINTIRAAKQVQAHIAAGGKLSDLPPPPPSENPDYVQCPHCKRRFNEAAAQRHIPKCADYQFNKPKGRR